MSLNGQTKDAFTKSEAGSWRYDIIFQGFKINRPDVLAAIGIAQMPTYFEKILGDREHINKFYTDYFSSKIWAILPPFQDSEKKSSCH